MAHAIIPMSHYLLLLVIIYLISSAWELHKLRLVHDK